MKKTLYLVPLIVFTALVSCGPSQKITSSWKNPQMPDTHSYKKLFIASLSANPNYRSIIERDLAAAAEGHGLQTVTGMDIFPAKIDGKQQISKDEALQRIRASGADAILTVALVDRQSETRYVPGTTTYMPHMGYAGFGGYYGYAYGAYYSTPGYYTEDKTYFMEARLFDVATENMIWSAQSEAYNPTKTDKFSRDYTAMLVDRMQRDFGKKK